MLNQKQQEIKQSKEFILHQNQLVYEMRCFAKLEDRSTNELGNYCNEMNTKKEGTGMYIIFAQELCMDAIFVDMFNSTKGLYNK